MSCLKFNYNPTQNAAAVKTAVVSKGYFYRENGIRLISQKESDLNKLKDNIIEALSKDFNWTTKSAKNLLVRDLDAVFNLYISNDKLDVITKQNLKTLKSLVRQEIGGASDLQEITPEETNTEQTTNKENSDEVKNSEKIKDLERSVYGTATSAKNYRQLLFERDLSKVCIVDVEAGTVVTGDEDLNNNIVDLKNRYYKNILAFLKKQSLNSDSFPEEMFDEDGVLQRNYIQTLNAFYRWLTSTQNLSQTINDSWHSKIKNQDSLLYDAVNSYFNLFYFDNLIKDTLGKTINIDKDLDGYEIDGNFTKYSFNDRAAELAKGWETQEYRDALQDIAKFSKLLIQSIPMYNRKTGAQSSTNLTMVSFTNAFTNIIAAIQNKDSIGARVNDKLIEAVYQMHSNPDKYIKQLLEQLFTDRIKDNVDTFLHYGITSYDADVLYSVYKHVYAEEDSINAIETRRLSQNFSHGQYPLVQCINGVIDRTMQMNYLQSIVESDGNTYVTVKKKYHSRQREYNTRNSINNQIIARDTDFRLELDNKYQVEPSTELENIGSWTFTIGTEQYMAKSGESSKIVLTADNLLVDGFIPNFDLSKQDVRNKLLHTDEQELTKDELQFKNILRFIQENLSPIKVLSEVGLDRLSLMEAIKEDNKSALSTLFAAAARAAVVNKIYLNYENLENPEINFYQYVIRKFPALDPKNLKDVQKRNLFTQGKGTDNLLAVKVSDGWIELYVTADATINGDVSKAVTKDLFGNSIANYSTAFMGGNLPYYLKQSLQTENSAQGKLLFAKQTNLVSGVVVNTDSEAKDGTKKSVKAMRVGELTYQSIFHNFWGTFLSDAKKSSLHGQYITQPTTYSDKTKIVSYIVNALKELDAIGRQDSPYHGKTLSELNTEETLLLYGDTLGDFYNQIYQNTLNKYSLIFGINPDLQEVLTAIEDFNNSEISSLVLKYKISDRQLIENKEQLLIKLAEKAGVELQLNSDYIIEKGTIRFNELLDYYVNYLFTFNEELGIYANLNKELQYQRINFLNDLINSNTIFYTNYFDGSDNAIGHIINEVFPTSYSDSKNKKFKELYTEFNPVKGANLKQKYLESWTRDNKLILAKEYDAERKVIKEYIFGELIPSNANIRINPLLEKYFMMDSLISNNLRLSLTGSEIAHPAKGAKALNVTDRLKKGFTDKYLKAIHNTESKAQGAQLKRNVIIPATLQYLQQNTLNGVSKKIRIAVLRDLGVNVFNFRGDDRVIDSMDGAALTTAYTSILENNSLQDQKVGENKKSIMHANTYLTGGAVLGKWATFALTNELMSQSLNSDVNLYELSKKLTNIQWHTSDGQINGEFIDINKMQGNKIDLIRGRGYHTNIPLNFQLDILRGKQLFYQDYKETLDKKSGNLAKKSTRIKQIIDFGKDGDFYYTEEQNVSLVWGEIRTQSTPHKIYHLFDQNSNHIKLTEEEYNALEDKSQYHSINSLFELHAAMGGLNSVEVDGNNWVISEASNYAVVNFMNNVSVRQTNNTKDFSQDNYYQPLKDAQISYAANNSSIKNGVANINQESSWKSSWEQQPKLSYMTITSDGLGIQMDADHEADEAELTEFSQVISALDAGGRLHSIAKQVYKDLGAVALQASSLEMEALQTFLDNMPESGTSQDKQAAISELYDVVGRTIINNFKQNNQANLADEIIAAIQSKFDDNYSHELDKLKIPFSDPGIYGSMLSTFVSLINNKSVKRKYPGSGYVMSPSYGFMQLWDINGFPHQFEDVFQLTSKNLNIRKNPLESYTQFKRRAVQEYLNELQQQEPPKDRMAFSPTDKVRVIITDKSGEQHIIQLSLDSPTDYVIFKQNYWTNLIKGKTTLDGKIITDNMLKGAVFQFFKDTTVSRDLAPAKITWEDPQGNIHNVFDEKPIRDSFTGTLEYTDSKGNVKSIIIPASWVKKIQNGNIDAVKFIKSEFKDTAKTYSVKKNETNRAAIQAVFDNLDKGVINGYQIQNLKTSAAEIIMSNMNRSKYPSNASLAQAVLNPDLFRINYPYTIEGPVGYDLAFIKQNGRHSYVTFGEVISDMDDINSPQEVKWVHTKPKPIKDTDGKLTDEGSVIWAMDRDSTLLFPIGVSKVVKNYEWVGDQVIDLDGKVVKGKFIKGKNNEVQQVTYFVKKYNIHQKNKDTSGRVKLMKNTLYKVDLKALTDNGWSNKQIADILSKLYSQEDFAEFRVNGETKFKENLLKIIPSLNFDNTNLSELVQTEVRKLLAAEKFDTNAYMKAIRSYAGKQNTAMYSSFLRQLEITASRIPAQTLQSFMQMRCVGYTQNKKNVCYVTPWQTYLQGSDYDIDKSYIMGSEINHNGIYIGWSPLFDYSSLETLKTSELLPFPTGKTLELSSTPTYKRNNKDFAYFDISDYIEKIAEYSNFTDNYIQNRIKILKLQTELLQEINDRSVGQEYKVYVNPEIIEKVGKDTVNNIIIRLNKHQQYNIPTELKESAYKNSVSSKINRIINDVKNMDSAYSPIEMEHIRPEESSSRVMSLTNPSTKFVMQVENMIGKNVIGIAAVGEKIFFNLTYYWNEQLRSKKDLNYLVFSHTYDRIQNRYKADKNYAEFSESLKQFKLTNPTEEALQNFIRTNRIKFLTNGQFLKPSQITKNKLTNINLDFEGIEDFKGLINEINDLLEETKLELPEEDVNSPIFQDRFHEKIRAVHDGESQADLYISELLSAATDNAKELILAQINAGTDLAGNYLFLLTLGFEIKDISSFMTSPALKIIHSLSEFNMFNDHMEPLNIENIVKLLQGDASVISTSKDNIIGKQLAMNAGIENPTNEDNNEAFRNYLENRVLGLTTTTVTEMVGSSYQVISDFIDIIVLKIRQNLDTNNLEYSLNEYSKDLDEFAIVSRRAREASNLGNVLLGMNQGLPSTKVDLLKKLRQIQDLVNRREKQLGITKEWIQSIKTELKESKDSESNNSETDELENLEKSTIFQEKVQELIQLNPELESGKLPSTQPGAVANILAHMIRTDFVTNFDARKWLMDDSYKDATKKYYNIIKDTWNIFDVVDKVPQFNSLLQLLKLVYMTDRELVLKSRVVDDIHRTLLKEGRYLDDYKLQQIIKYVDDRLIVSWLQNTIGNEFVIPVEEGSKYFDINGDLRVSPATIAYDLTTSEGRATFKYIMEKHIIPRLQNDSLKKIDIDDNKRPIYTDEVLELSDNKFIEGLVLVQDNQGVPFYKLDIDMMAIDASTANQEKYQNYLDGLLQLQGVTYAGHPLSDWFMMYNLYVHKNNYGQDRMTTIFRSFIQQVPNSLISQYYEYMGNKDYGSTEDTIEELGINYDDINLAMAPFVSEQKERFSKEPYIKQSKDGFVVYKRKDNSNRNGGYIEIPRYPNRKLVGDIETKKDNARKTNAIEYFMMWAPNQENIDYFTRKLRSDNAQDILEALGIMQSQGIVQITISDCT